MLQVSERPIHAFILNKLTAGVRVMLIGNQINVNAAYDNIMSQLGHQTLYRYPVDVYYPGGSAAPYTRLKLLMQIVGVEPLGFHV